jgi:hypothetical protein
MAETKAMNDNERPLISLIKYEPRSMWGYLVGVFGKISPGDKGNLILLSSKSPSGPALGATDLLYSTNSV